MKYPSANVSSQAVLQASHRTSLRTAFLRFILRVQIGYNSVTDMLQQRVRSSASCMVILGDFSHERHQFSPFALHFYPSHLRKRGFESHQVYLNFFQGWGILLTMNAECCFPLDPSKSSFSTVIDQFAYWMCCHLLPHICVPAEFIMITLLSKKNSQMETSRRRTRDSFSG